MREHIEHGLSLFLLAGLPQLPVHRRADVLLEELHVVLERRGEGHGRALMETAMSTARERGAPTMELGTATNDHAARGLYESLGFSNLEKASDVATAMPSCGREL